MPCNPVVLQKESWVCCCRPVGVPHSEAVASLNASYLDANEGVLTMTRTSSASLLRMRGKATKQFVLKPGHLDFGTVKLGQVTFHFFSFVSLHAATRIPYATRPWVQQGLG